MSTAIILGKQTTPTVTAAAATMEMVRIKSESPLDIIRLCGYRHF